MPVDERETTRECEICDEFASSDLPGHYSLRGVPPEGRVLVETRNLVLVPDYAPLMPGHLLLLPRPHALSMSDHLVGEASGLNELAWVLDDYVAEYGRISIIEHGSNAEVERESPCIAHAHLHLLPVDAHDLRLEFAADAADNLIDVSWNDAVNRAAGTEYVLVGDRNNVSLATNWRPPARQYARSLLARIFNLPKAQTYSDTCVAPEIVASTIERWMVREVG